MNIQNCSVGQIVINMGDKEKDNNKQEQPTQEKKPVAEPQAAPETCEASKEEDEVAQDVSNGKKKVKRIK